MDHAQEVAAVALADIPENEFQDLPDDIQKMLYAVAYGEGTDVEREHVVYRFGHIHKAQSKYWRRFIKV